MGSADMLMNFTLRPNSTPTHPSAGPGAMPEPMPTDPQEN